MKAYERCVRRLAALQAVLAHVNGVADSMAAIPVEWPAAAVQKRNWQEISKAIELMDRQLLAVCSEFASELGGMLPPAVELILEGGLASEGNGEIVGEPISGPAVYAIAKAIGVDPPKLETVETVD